MNSSLEFYKKTKSVNQLQINQSVMLAYLKPIQLHVQLQMMGFSQAQLQVQLQMTGLTQAQLQVQLQLKQINPHSSTTASAKGGLRSNSTAITMQFQMQMTV